MPASPQYEVPLTLGAQLDARAADASVAARAAVRHGDRTLTWSELRDDGVRHAHFLLRRLGAVDDARPAHVAMLMDNQPELLSLLAGCAYAGATLFGVNTGLRGETLAGVLNQSRSRVLVVGERYRAEVEKVLAQLDHIAGEHVLFVPEVDAAAGEAGSLAACVESEVAPFGTSLDAPDVEVSREDNLMVIYTSGTTGLPKGINNNHLKLNLIGARVAGRLQLDTESVGYACMPLFHSNAMFLGFMPALRASACLALRDRFSASHFVPDVLRYGVTYWNYVGEPVHYILAALIREHGEDDDAIRAAVAEHPDNRLRYAVGNGASPPDIDRFVRWLGLEDMYELYGSTEAAISTFRTLSDPRGSVGAIEDPAVRILREDGSECPSAVLDAAGKITNYAEAVGEICRVAPDTSLFQGYYENAEANASKYREGVYHSGDLGHILEQDGTRYLYFDGRTDDWIRKDGENFSAAQVARLLSEHEDVVLAAAYGAPCAVSDELVMGALKLREGATFDPKEFYAFCQRQVREGGMDPKWVPDFVRVVEEFEYTQTQKVLVRSLKQVHFDRRRLPDAPLFWRERGDDTFRPFSAADFDALRERFRAAEREDLLDR